MVVVLIGNIKITVPRISQVFHYIAIVRRIHNNFSSYSNIVSWPALLTKTENEIIVRRITMNFSFATFLTSCKLLFLRSMNLMSNWTYLLNISYFLIFLKLSPSKLLLESENFYLGKGSYHSSVSVFYIFRCSFQYIFVWKSWLERRRFFAFYLQ